MVSNNLNFNSAMSRINAKTSGAGARGMFSGVGGFILIIVIILAVVVGIYFISTMFSADTNGGLQLVGKPIKTSEVKHPQRAHIKGETTPLIYSYTGWIFIQNYNTNFGVEKMILSRGSNNSGYKLNLASTDNVLEFTAFTRSSSTNPQTYSTCVIKNFPIQTWVHYALVINNRNIDFYINGRLERTCVMGGLPIAPNTTDPIIYLYPESHSFMGQVSRTFYYMRNLSPTEVYTDYSRGPFQNTNFSF